MEIAWVYLINSWELTNFWWVKKYLDHSTEEEASIEEKDRDDLKK